MKDITNTLEPFRSCFEDTKVTDIVFNGKSLFVRLDDGSSHVDNELSDCMTDVFIKRFANELSSTVDTEFSAFSPIITIDDAVFDNIPVRICMVHGSVCDFDHAKGIFSIRICK